MEGSGEYKKLEREMYGVNPDKIILKTANYVEAIAKRYVNEKADRKSRLLPIASFFSSMAAWYGAYQVASPALPPYMHAPIFSIGDPMYHACGFVATLITRAISYGLEWKNRRDVEKAIERENPQLLIEKKRIENTPAMKKTRRKARAIQEAFFLGLGTFAWPLASCVSLVTTPFQYIMYRQKNKSDVEAVKAVKRIETYLERTDDGAEVQKMLKKLEKDPLLLDTL